MAEKQVIRQDVVQVTWDVEDDPLKELVNTMKEFKNIGEKSTNGVTNGVKETVKHTNKLKGAWSAFTSKMSAGWSALTKGAETLKSKLTPLNDKLNQLGRSALNVGKKFVSGIGRLAKTAVVGLSAAFAGFAALGTAAVKNYAEYEQLVGGVETLFKNSSADVVKYAENAYKTAGLSSNDYMETVTSFSASLLAGLGGDTKEAAKIADLAITDMSDNANKMGTDMSSIQNAYQGFAKQNWSMLDNLKLGYGGTESEMIRLMNDSGVLKKKIKDMDEVSFDQVIKAINAIQTKMGITGTTAKEASSTIQGSITSMKAAWTNFLTGMADPNQDFDKLVGNVVDSVVTVGKNLIPRIAAMAPRLARGLKELGASLLPYIPPLVDKIVTKVKELAPKAAQAVSKLVMTAKQWLIDHKGEIWEGFKSALAGGANFLSELFTGEGIDIEGTKQKIQEIADKVIEIVGAFKENWPVIKGAIIGVVGAIALLKGALLACNIVIGINTAITKVKTAIDLAAAAKTKILAAKQWLLNASFLGCPLVWLIAAFVALIAIVVLVVKNWDTIKVAVTNAWTAFQGFLDKLGPFGAAIKEMINGVILYFKDMWSGIKQAWEGVKLIFTGIIDFVVGVFTGDWARAWEGVKSVFGGIWEALKGLAKAPLNAVIRMVNKAIGGINGISVTIPDWVPGFGGKTIGFSIPKIPELAEGGVLKRGQVGLLEGNGAEAVVPLEKNTGWIRAVAQALSAQTSRASSNTRSSYSPDTGHSSGSRSYSESNTYAPVFNLNFTGTTDRTAERVIKQWIRESMDEVFDSMSRTSPRVTEV